MERGLRLVGEDVAPTAKRVRYESSPGRRLFPCGVCGLDVGRNQWAHAECAETQRRESVQRELDEARATIPPEYRWAEFGAPLLERRVKPAAQIRIVSAAWLQRERMMTLTGPSGSGKTSLACCLLKATLDSGVRGVETSRFVRSWELAKARSEHALGRGEAPLVTLALRADVLVIDELGEELRSSSKLVRGDTAIRDVLHARQAEGRRTVVTTYLSVREIGELYGAGIARRMDERGLVVELGGAS